MEWIKLIDLNISNQELENISRDGIDAMGPLVLSLIAMETMKDHFNKRLGNP